MKWGKKVPKSPSSCRSQGGAMQTTWGGRVCCETDQIVIPKQDATIEPNNSKKKKYGNIFKNQKNINAI